MAGVRLGGGRPPQEAESAYDENVLLYYIVIFDGLFCAEVTVS